MADPYELLGVERKAGETQLKAAYRRRAKTAHPDSGGDPETFDAIRKAYELLQDPVRRKIFDETGYDTETADAVDLQALVIVEKLVTETILDERDPGSFDPLSQMRTTLAHDIDKASFNRSELERHAARVELHLQRLGSRPGKDVLAHMFRARIDAITKAIGEMDAKILATRRACDMLEGYTYDVEPPQPLPDSSVSNLEWLETAKSRSTG